MKPVSSVPSSAAASRPVAMVHPSVHPAAAVHPVTVPYPGAANPVATVQLAAAIHPATGFDPLATVRPTAAIHPATGFDPLATVRPTAPMHPASVLNPTAASHPAPAMHPAVAMHPAAPMEPSVTIHPAATIHPTAVMDPTATSRPIAAMQPAEVQPTSAIHEVNKRWEAAMSAEPPRSTVERVHFAESTELEQIQIFQREESVGRMPKLPGIGLREPEMQSVVMREMSDMSPYERGMDLHREVSAPDFWDNNPAAPSTAQP